jgi:hypothetical protein
MNKLSLFHFCILLVTMNKTLILATFIFPERLEWFLEYLETKFDIDRKKVFVFQNLDDESKLIVTFKLVLKDGKKINLKKYFPSPIIIHKKGNALYTINALNMLIEKESGMDKGNIDYKSFKIDWDKYQDRLILNNHDKLTIFKIRRVFP